MKTIHFQLKDINSDPKTTGFEGYYVIASFVLITTDGLMSSALKAELDNKGSGVLYLPPDDQIDQDLLHFEFYGPGGYWIAERITFNESKFASSNDAQHPYDIKIAIMKDKNLEKAVYTVNGRLVDVSARQKISKHSFHVIESETEEIENNNYKIVQAVVTDIEGYFRFEINLPPKKETEPIEATQKYYFAIIPSSTEKIIKLRMNNNLVEDRQIIAITLAPQNPISENKDKDPDCACDDTPRLPSASDYGSLEGVFSQDLGIGCMEFTKANRVMEEYQFMHIVRTTDPQIKKVNLHTHTFQEILGSLTNELKEVKALKADEKQIDKIEAKKSKKDYKRF